MSHHRFEHSSPIVEKNLSLFQLPPTELGVDQIQWVHYRPASQSDEGPLEFVISGAGHQYIDLQNSRLYIKAKILKADGSKIPLVFKDTNGSYVESNMNPEGFVSPVNLWLHSLFDQVDLLMQQEVVNSSNLYPYRSYLETLIYPYEPTLGEAELFYKDSFTSMDATKVLIGKNFGLDRRNLRGTTSQDIDMEGVLHLDICCQSRYILNGIDIGLKLWPSRDSFSLMSDIGECQVKITDAVLKVCKVEVAPSVLDTHNNIMKHNMTAKYPGERTHMKSFTIVPGLQSFNKEDIFLGEVPHKVVCGLVSSAAFNGDFKKNPFNFIHGYISEIGIKVDNKPVPEKPLKTKFGDHCNSANAFRALFDDHPDLNITRDEFEHGYTLFSFTTQKGKDQALNTLQKGNCGIEIKFSKVTEEAMTLVIMAKFPSVMEITHDRQVTV